MSQYLPTDMATGDAFPPSSNMYKISFVVNDHPALYFQAELLLLSLECFARHKKEDILVQCTSLVNDTFLSFLKDNHYNYTIFEPYLDGKYCNKIKQLEAFQSAENFQGVFLLDTDVFALSPILPPNPHVFCGKIVDGPNPPLEVLSRIYEAAQLNHGQIVLPDWDWGKSTISGYFNGGFYYIPKKYIAVITEGWQKWATWLFARPELFQTNEQTIFVEQVAMSMAVSEAQIEYIPIASNYNCPIHHPGALRFFETNKPVFLLHYHRELNVFGLLNTESASNDAIISAIRKANAAIAAHADFSFFEQYRQSLIEPIQHTEKTRQLFEQLSSMIAQRRNKLNLIIHCGTPKTGTTSLQFFFHHNYQAFLDSGFLYPNLYLKTYAPKHQWLMRSLITADVEMLIRNFQVIFSELREDTHTIILSTEGVYNHWNDYSQEAKSFLSVLGELFNTEAWLWLRNPVSFIDSLYRQCLKNPQIVRACYGTDMSLPEMLQDKWFAGHLDYLGFVSEITSIFGRENVKVFQHTGDIIYQVEQTLKLNAPFKTPEKENIGLSDSAIEQLRIINRFPLTVEEKEECVNLLTTIDNITSRYPQPKKVEDNESIRLIHELSSLQMAALNRHHTAKI